MRLGMRHWVLVFMLLVPLCAARCLWGCELKHDYVLVIKAILRGRRSNMMPAARLVVSLRAFVMEGRDVVVVANLFAEEAGRPCNSLHRRRMVARLSTLASA